jgi:PmbA protein
MIEKIEEIFDKQIQNISTYNIDGLYLSAIYKSKRGVNIYQSEIDAVEIADSVQMGVMVEKDHRFSCALTENLTDEGVEFAINQAILTNEFVDVQNKMSLAQSDKESYSSSSSKKQISIDELKDLAIKSEKKAYDFSSYINNVPYTYFGLEDVHRLVQNSQGTKTLETNHLFQGAISLASFGKTNRPVNYHHSKSIIDNQFDLDHFVKNACEETILRMDPEKTTSGNYTLIFDPRVCAQLLMAFIPAFYGDALDKKITRLENQLDQKISSSILNLIDDPTCGLIPHRYDGEGNQTQGVHLIENGVFKSFLHNTLTANKTNQTNTGNATYSLGMLPGVQYSNLRIDGEISENLISNLDHGILIKELHGASHSPISGDFSYGGVGYLIEEGKIKKPINDFTVAGNFFDLLNKVEKIGDDLEYYFPKTLGSVGGRSLQVSDITISG